MKNGLPMQHKPPVVRQDFLDSLSRRRVVLCSLLASCFAFISLVGRSFSEYGSASSLFSDTSKTISSFAIVLLLSSIILMIILMVYYALDKMIVRSEKEHTKHRSVNKVKRYVRFEVQDKHFLAISFFTIFACYLPVLILLYPGSLPHDGYNQINQFMGISPLNNSHPVVSTIIIGFLFSIGRSLGGDNFGVFFYVLIQSIFLAYVFAKSSMTIKGFGKDKLAISSVVFFALCPIWPLYAATVIKDTLFLVFFVDFSLTIINLLSKEATLSIRPAIRLVIISLLVCWTRHNGIYVVLPTLLAMIFLSSETNRRNALYSTCFIFVSCLILSNAILPFFHVESASANEMMSVPYQQTARYVIMHPDEITEEEREIINTSIDFNRIPELYNPELSDPIKWSYSFNSSPSRAYLKLWFKMFFRHPMTYISATFHNTYGYYYPFSNFDVMSTFQLYTKGEPVATGDFDIHYVLQHERTHATGDQRAPEVVIDYADAWRNLPVLQLLTRPGVYTWFLMMLAVYLVDKRQYIKLVALLPAVFLFLTCLVSPVNGLLRYAMPYMAVTVLLWSFATYNIESVS